MINASRFTHHALRFKHLIILVAYLALALILTYPLVTQFGDHVPGTTTWSMDEYGYVWNNWWFKHAIFDLQTNPFQTNYLLYPIGTSLILYAFTLLHVLLGLPIQFAFGLIPASNTELIFAFVMCGYGTYLLVSYLLRNSQFPIRNSELGIRHYDLAAFVAGSLFAFSSNRFVYASLGHYNIVAAEWMPFYILFLVKTVREPKWKNALLAGLFAAFALYTEATHGVLLFLFTLGYLILSWRQVVQRTVLARLVVVGATAVILFAPLLIPTVNEILNSGYTLPGWGHSEKLLVDLFGFFSPTALQPLYRNWVSELDQVRRGVARFSDINTVFLGYFTLILATLAAIRFRQVLSVWIVSAITFAIFSLGPLLHINGKSVFDFDGLSATFPMPFLLLHYIPFIRENRAPNRFSALVMLSLAVMVGFAGAWASSKLKGKRQKWNLLLVFSFLFLILFEHSAIPLPLTDSRIPDIYTQIGKEPGNFSVLTLPLGWRNSFGQIGAEDSRVQYYQSAHGKFAFSANIQRNPPFQFDYFNRLPVFNSIAQLESYQKVSDDTIARDKAIALSLMTFFDVRYLVIQPSIPGRPPYGDTRNATADYALSVLPLGEKIYERDGLIAYRVNQAPLPAKQQIQFGTDAAFPYQGEGWDRAESIMDESANWANRTSARIIFPIRDIADYQITLRALPFTYSNSPVQKIQAVVNGEAIQSFDLKTAWENYSLTIPARVLHSGLNDLILKFDYAVRPHDVLPVNFAIGKTGTNSPVDIAVTSGDSVSIKVNGQEKSLLGQGYNVVVVDPKTGNVIDSRVFDTTGEIIQSRAMSDFLTQIPNGMIVTVAARGNVAANLGDRTFSALQMLGAQIDLRKTTNQAHAIIGVKGAPAGTAIEQTSASNVFLSVGHSADERTLAAAVSSVTIERK
jgi:hypothetical protein